MQPIDVARQFANGVISIAPLGNGHINDTYFVASEAQPFVLQKINKNVFPKPEQIMVNLAVLNQYVREADVQQKALKIPDFLVTETGLHCFQDEQGDYWRALSFIENTESHESINYIAEAEQVGLALGQFHRLTRTLDTNKLFDTLPGFHICPAYLQHYHQVEKTTQQPNDAFCSNFIKQYQPIAEDLEVAKAQGLIAERVIHGDPKLNNFLFDKDSQRIVSIVDLDTVKPGLVHYDIGDCIRSCCHIQGSDTLNLEICQALLCSYLEEMGAYFSEYDYQFLYPAIRLIPFELGLRFYTDYLEGNRYFKVTEPKENLYRAIAQFRLCSDVIKHEDEIIRFVEH